MPKKIIFIRHGETDHNLKKLAQGWLDVNLNKNGQNQAKKVAKKLKNEVIHHVYSSDLKRALHTAEKIAKKGKFPIKNDKRIREWNMGNWAGLGWGEIMEKFKHIYNDKGAVIDHEWKEHQGESINQMKKRLKYFIKHLEENHQDQNVAVVTHGGAKRLLLQIFKIIPENEKPSFKNTSVSIIEKDKNGSYKLKLFNDTSHLGE